ncbi:MAG: TadE/TadG family type IV pilus assembly protein [Terriglobales bacterium]
MTRHLLRPPAAIARRTSTGSALVEFALVIPVLLMLLLGTVELGWGIYVYHFVASAASQAARYASVRGAECSSWPSACPASASDIQTYVRDLAPGAIDTSALTVSTTWTPNNSPGSVVNVTVQYNFLLNVPFTAPITLSLQTSSDLVINQ